MEEITTFATLDGTVPAPIKLVSPSKVISGVKREPKTINQPMDNPVLRIDNAAWVG